MIISQFNTNIDKYKSPQFTARNPEIRFADDIIRQVNKTFPRISNSKLDDLQCAEKFTGLLKRIYSQIFRMRNYIYYENFCLDSLRDQLKLLTETIKRTKLGNCAESSILAEIALRANGIKDCQQVNLFQKRLSVFHDDLDHTAILVHNNGKPYIIDAWLGFADYLPNALKRYSGEFRHYFDIKGKKPNLFFKENTKGVFYDLFDCGYEKSELKKLFPDLIHNKKP